MGVAVKPTVRISADRVATFALHRLSRTALSWQTSETGGSVVAHVSLSRSRCRGRRLRPNRSRRHPAPRV